MITGFDNIFSHHIIMQICNDGKIREDYQCVIGRRAIWLRGKGAKSHRELNLSTHIVQIQSRQSRRPFAKAAAQCKRPMHTGLRARASPCSLAQCEKSRAADSLSSVLVSFAQLRLCCCCLFTATCWPSRMHKMPACKKFCSTTTSSYVYFYGVAIL